MNSEYLPNDSRPDVMYWDPQDIGHHRRYLDAVVGQAPIGSSMLVPSWFLSEPPPHVAITPIEQTSNDEYGALREAIDRYEPRSVILGLGHKLSRRLAVAAKRMNIGVVVLDLRGVTAAVKGRHRTSPIDYPRAVIDASLREVAVRRGRIAYLTLNPDAILGSRKVHDASETYRDPLEVLHPYPSCATCADRKRIVLAGALSGRKGITDLSDAVSLLPAQRQEELEVVIAGVPQEDGREQIARAMRTLSATRATIRVVVRRLGDDELAALLDTADVVALPYRNHRGGSGLLGTAMACTAAQVVVSDFGVSGSIAEGLGAITFANADVTSLSKALESALDAGRRSEPVSGELAARFYGTHSSFGAHVWRMVGNVTDASAER